MKMSDLPVRVSKFWCCCFGMAEEMTGELSTTKVLSPLGGAVAVGSPAMPAHGAIGSLPRFPLACRKSMR